MSINILAIETSCDETSASVVSDGREILSNIIASQIDIHKEYGGVVPEIASRKHLEVINLVIRQSMLEAGVGWSDLNAVAVTSGPGLVGSLLIGVSAAKAISYAANIPLIAVNHIESHIYANFLAHPVIEFPFICLVVSGGHTELIYFSKHNQYQILGHSRDDAAGEAFDKVARTIGLPYPGGPAIDQLALLGNPDAYRLPKAYLEEGCFDFSFSGLKSAVLNMLNHAKLKGEHIDNADLAASFQKAVVEVLTDKLLSAQESYNVNTILLAGGVAANQGLRKNLKQKVSGRNIKLFYPPSVLCTDNAAMVGCAAYYHFLQADFAPMTLNAVPHLKLGQKLF